MLKGLAITPPVVGRIAIGRIVERNGKRLPEKDDAFTITTQVQQRGEWLLHPMHEALRKATPGKLRSIPVRMLFADPDLNLRADFSLFDRDTGRPVCVGNGETCRRTGKDGNGIETLPCPSPDGCGFGKQGGCKPYARLNVLIGDDDEMGSFILRTTSFNSIRTLAARLHYFRAISGNLLACLPLELKLRGKSTTQSYRAPIYYVDLTVRSGSTLEEALTQAQERNVRRKLAGFDQAALDAAARLGFANGAFEDSPDERAAVAEEFYPAAETSQSNSDPTHSDPASPAKSTLREKLDRQAALLGGTAA
ncbi:phage capsid protein [Trinickia dinghuensis]|uniref:Phage capsid protein n=1 Tax=Trinickia dinghuensis TaxID=2291023 RepID=A0A3D8JZD2_9BURK|nr:phage capsid protein [Trinickia dinghuensis]RDU98172.1 phage capsid protein [Trinickia dinghuensis]